MTEDPIVQPLAVPVSEGAEMIRRHKAWLYRRIYEGEIKVCKNFGRLMIPVSELQKFVGPVTTHTPRKNDPRGRKSFKKQVKEGVA